MLSMRACSAFYHLTIRLPSISMLDNTGADKVKRLAHITGFVHYQ